MFVLPPPLAALRTHRQFIVYQLVPSTVRPGKTDKFPIDWRTGHWHDAHDPAIWCSVEEAAAYAEVFGEGFGVGFVFTEACGLFFIDIDSCIIDGAYTPTALALMSLFEGAAVEISASGAGLHIIGTGVAPKPRKVKYHNYFDLYTEARFVALTGTAAIGDAATLHTPALTQLVADYLMPTESEKVSDWTTEPDPRWRGSNDDAEIIRRASMSKSVNQAFGVKASFEDLFNCNVEVLARIYPPDGNSTNGLPYDASKVDSALAQSLAFWTGKNCERIERIMRMSQLAREKWNDGGYYLDRTIRLCCARQFDVLEDKPAEASAVVAALEGAAEATLVTGATFLSLEEQFRLFKGCVYVWRNHRALVPGGHLLKPDQFKVMFGGYSFPMDGANEKVTRNAWEAFTESQIYRSPRADDVCFRPELAPAVVVNESGQKLANIWWPIQTPQADGDPGPFLWHMQKLLPVEDDRLKLLSYMAAVVQNPGFKIQWAPLIQGTPGNGKTLLITAVARAVGYRYTHLPNSEDLVAGGAKFTGWLQQKLFIGLEEIYTGDRRNMMEALKPLITNSRIEIQAKGQDQFTGDNRANFMAGSNHKDAVPKTEDERRWSIFFTAQQSFEDLARDGMDGNYMPDLYNWFEGRGRYVGQAPGWQIINRYLRTFAIPEALDPTGAMHRAPETSSTSEAIMISVGAIEQEIMEAVAQDVPGFAGGWVSSMALDKLLVRLNAERRVPLRKRKELLANLGYEPHRHLPDGRVHNPVEPDGGKTRLYVKKGSILQNIGEPRLVARYYTEAQTKAAIDKARNSAIDTAVK